MKIPKKLKIGGHLIKVESSKNLDNADGDFSSKTNTIRICSSLPQSQKEETLIHEIFHALNSSYDEGDKHGILESFSQQLYQVLSDNEMLR